MLGQSNQSPEEDNAQSDRQSFDASDLGTLDGGEAAVQT